MVWMYSKQSGFTYSAWEPFTKNKERTQKFEETGDTKYIFKNKFGKACFQHGMTDGGFKDLARKIASDKVLRDKASNFAKNTKHDGYQRGLAFLIKNLQVMALIMKLNKMNIWLIIRKC